MRVIEILRVAEAVVAHQVEAHHYTGCDGYPAAAVFDAVGVTTADGRQWALPNGFRVVDEDGFVGYVNRYDASQMADRVQARGVICAANWVEMEQQESFEERFAPFGTEWQLEQQDRQEWGA